MHDRNLYANPELGISIEKPEEWCFIPPQWALPLLLGRTEPAAEKVDELMKYARAPLFYFHFDHGRPDRILPTVYGMHRTLAGIGSADRSALLEMQVAQLEAVFEDFTLIEATPDGIISQRPANIIKSTYSAYTQGGERLECLSRSYLIFAGDFMIGIEMSGPPGGEFRCEDEFRSILGSVRID